MAAVSRSTIPSLLASICSSVAGSTLIDGFDGPSVGDDFVPPLFRPSETRGTPPSFAWTVRSCLRRRSRRTKVLRHFAHLNGRSLVSACRMVSHQKISDPAIRAVNICPTQQPKNIRDLRERSCRLRCSLRLKARLQNWHLYFFSGADAAFRGEGLAVEVEGLEVAMTAVECLTSYSLSRSQDVNEAPRHAQAFFAQE